MFNANKYQYKEEAEKILNNSFTLVDTLEVVEITIAEGDLQEINEQLNKNLIEMEKSKLRWENKYFTLEQQLAKKDQEIEKLHKILDSQKRHIDIIEQFFRGRGTKRTGNVILDFELSIREQVCDEIRKQFENRYKGKNWNDNIIIGKVCNTINDVIDQIEQAKESIDGKINN